MNEAKPDALFSAMSKMTNFKMQLAEDVIKPLPEGVPNVANRDFLALAEPVE